MELLQNEAQFNINGALDKELWNLSRPLMIINCEINVIKRCTTATEQEGLVRMILILSNSFQDLPADRFLPYKNLNSRNLIGVINGDF